LNFLARREHSRGELRQKLSRKGFPEPLIDAVIADFHERGWQSDTRFAEVFARSRMAKGYGACRIRQELRQRGITGSAAFGTEEVDWDGQIESIHARKFGETVPGSLQERAARERFLLQRGFTGDQVRRLFRVCGRRPMADASIQVFTNGITAEA